MNILTASTLDAVVEKIQKIYPQSITTVPAPGDTGRWFVLQGGYVLPGLHIVLKGESFVFCTLAF